MQRVVAMPIQEQQTFRSQQQNQLQALPLRLVLQIVWDQHSEGGQPRKLGVLPAPLLPKGPLQPVYELLLMLLQQQQLMMEDLGGIVCTHVEVCTPESFTFHQGLLRQAAHSNLRRARGKIWLRRWLLMQLLLHRLHKQSQLLQVPQKGFTKQNLQHQAQRGALERLDHLIGLQACEAQRLRRILACVQDPPSELWGTSGAQIHCMRAQ